MEGWIDGLTDERKGTGYGHDFLHPYYAHGRGVCFKVDGKKL